MLLIQKNGESFFIDRDNSVFKIDVIKFPHYKETHRLLYDTLLDGVIIDNLKFTFYLYD